MKMGIFLQDQPNTYLRLRVKSFSDDSSERVCDRKGIGRDDYRVPVFASSFFLQILSTSADSRSEVT